VHTELQPRHGERLADSESRTTQPCVLVPMYPFNFFFEHFISEPFCFFSLSHSISFPPSWQNFTKFDYFISGPFLSRSIIFPPSLQNLSKFDHFISEPFFVFSTFRITRSISMYVCMYVCMHKCVYVCMYVCQYVRTYTYLDATCLYIFLICMHKCIHVCMYMYIYVYMYVYAHIHT
jgi:hypothetical protein